MYEILYEWNWKQTFVNKQMLHLKKRTIYYVKKISITIKLLSKFVILEWFTIPANDFFKYGV